MSDWPPNTRRAAVGGIAGGVFAASARHARAKPIQLKLASADTMNDTSYEAGQRFGAEIAKRTSNKYDVQLFVNGALGSTVNMANSLQTGIIDCATLTSGYLESIIPVVQCTDLPVIFKDKAISRMRPRRSQCWTAIWASAVRRNGGPGDQARRQGLCGWRQMELSDRAMKTLDDIRCLKIRIQPGPDPAQL